MINLVFKIKYKHLILKPVYDEPNNNNNNNNNNNKFSIVPDYINTHDVIKMNLKDIFKHKDFKMAFISIESIINVNKLINKNNKDMMEIYYDILDIENCEIIDVSIEKTNVVSVSDIFNLYHFY